MTPLRGVKVLSHFARWVFSSYNRGLGIFQSHRGEKDPNMGIPPPYWRGEVLASATTVLGVTKMARVCEVTGKGPMVGNNVSHANNKTKRRFLPNLQYRRFWVESENRWVRLRVSSAALRLIDKKGIDTVLADLRARGQA